MTDADLQIFEAVGALVVVLDVDGRIVHWNRRCSELTGYSVEDVRGRRLWDCVLVPDEVESVRAVLATVPMRDRPTCHANHWVTRTGERRWISFSHSLTRHSDGGAQYIITTGLDQTELKRADTRLYDDAMRATDDLREANQHMVGATIRAQEMTEQVEAALTLSEESERQLRATAEFREMFIGIVGHDLRNPLGTISLAAHYMLRRGFLDERDREAVTQIISGSERMSRMILQLLDFTRTRLGGGFPIEPVPSDLRDICGTIAGEFGDGMHLELEGDLTGTWDADRLVEALSNIVRNAHEHAVPGTPVVVRAYAEGADAGVEISNRGEAIPPEVLPFIFEPFRRGKGERSTTGNLGLGLYIAKQIVLAAGGTLDAHSADGTTTFRMRLPRAVAALASSA